MICVVKPDLIPASLGFQTTRNITTALLMEALEKDGAPSSSAS